MAGNSDNDKVPSAIHLGNNVGGDVSWGYDIALDKKPIKWFKLLLIDAEDLPTAVSNSALVSGARKQLMKMNKTAIEVIGLYLRLLWNHAIDVITTALGSSLVMISTFRVVVTLPAIWPEYAKKRMRDAIEFSGITNSREAGQTQVSFVSEPEAAALSTLHDMSDRHDVQADDTFIVVDCGGGTVDIISYKVISNEPVVVRECVKGQGM